LKGRGSRKTSFIRWMLVVSHNAHLLRNSKDAAYSCPDAIGRAGRPDGEPGPGADQAWTYCGVAPV